MAAACCLHAEQKRSEMRKPASADGTTLDIVNGAAPVHLTAVPRDALSEDWGSALIMTFDTLTPVAGPYAGAANAVRGIAGAGLPWVLEGGSGSLSRDGHLLVRIRGLVLASHQPVPVSLRGTNPFPGFRVVVSCMSVGPDGTAAIANVSTGDFEASSSGNSDVDARVSIPQPCLAPIVLVTGPSGAERWVAVTGR
jgi:hypothetical protein